MEPQAGGLCLNIYRHHRALSLSFFLVLIAIRLLNKYRLMLRHLFQPKEHSECPSTIHLLRTDTRHFR